jgi:hypothetical protein
MIDLRNKIYELLEERVKGVKIYRDDLYGTVALVETDLSARDALELWLKLIDCFPYEKYGTVISLRWLGENNISGGELVDYLVKIMIKSKVGPRALPGFDAVRMTRETRLRRCDHEAGGSGQKD